MCPFCPFELMAGVEPATSSLPRKASALSTELFPQFRETRDLHISSALAVSLCGCGWIRTTEAEKQQIYSLPHLATLEHTQFQSINSMNSLSLCPSSFPKQKLRRTFLF